MQAAQAPTLAAPPMDPAEAGAELMKLCRTIRNERPQETSSARKAPRPSNRPRPPRCGLARRYLNTDFSFPTFLKLWTWVVALFPKRVRRSPVSRLARRYPGLLAWCVVFSCVGVLIAGQGSGIPHPHRNPAKYQKWLQERGAEAVRATLAEIGPGVIVPVVRARPINDWVIGTYNGGDRTVTFNSDYEFDDALMLDVAAHECVHAIFDQEGLAPYSTKHRDYFSVVNETAAYVLGAYIAGDAYSRLGNDGELLTEKLIQEYRHACDPANPASMFNQYLAPGRRNSGDFDRERWHSALIHYGPLDLVDAVDQICRQRPVPTSAAKAIAHRFMRTDLGGNDRAILEEFDRRRRR
jgi:hypothetical protein